MYNSIKTYKTSRIKFNQVSKNLYTESYKRLMKETEDTNKKKANPCSWIGKLDVAKMTILPKASYRFNPTPFKTAMAF